MIIGTIVLGCIAAGMGVLLFFTAPTVMLTHRLDVYAAREKHAWERVNAAFGSLGAAVGQLGYSTERATKAFARFGELFQEIEEQK